MNDRVRTTITDGIARLTLDRPEVHNAFDAALIAELTLALNGVGTDKSVRVVILSGAGASFSAGADLNWMRSMAGASEADNRADSERLAALMHTLNFLPKPVIARVHGAAYGGGVGLVACCDIAIAADSAKFGLTETRLGLVPAVISPYVVDAIGVRQARRYFQSAEVFDAATARQLGLVHEVVNADALDAAVDRQTALLLKAGPTALREAKLLALKMAGVTSESRALEDRRNAVLIARLRVSAEGQEGLAAFLDKRPAQWVP